MELCLELSLDKMQIESGKNPSTCISILMRGHDSRVVWVSEHALPCHEFEPSITQDPQCRGVHVKSVNSSNVLPLEDFGKRNMPGKRARRHFSQLREFESGQVIGMKTAGWSTRRVAGQVDRSECAVRNYWEQWTPEGTHARKTGSGATRKTTRREDRRIVWQALVNPIVTSSSIRADVGVAIVPQTISRHLAEANLKSKHPFRALPLTPAHRQLRLQWCQVRSMWNVTVLRLAMNPGLFWGQMIIVYGCGSTLVRGTIPPHCSTSHCPHSWCNGLGGHSL
ncbi:HTH_Tnp_Tc3_2 domain-containing protein [Trichonephila clavipes]|nr:HTH_Tnp_Tc3_2 domain-containing protein [Trichonephila clavipes]